VRSSKSDLFDTSVDFGRFGGFEHEKGVKISPFLK
jgi:hypothetical protein